MFRPPTREAANSSTSIVTSNRASHGRGVSYLDSRNFATHDPEVCRAMRKCLCSSGNTQEPPVALHLPASSPPAAPGSSSDGGRHQHRRRRQPHRPCDWALVVVHLQQHGLLGIAALARSTSARRPYQLLDLGPLELVTSRCLLMCGASICTSRRSPFLGCHVLQCTSSPLHCHQRSSFRRFGDIQQHYPSSRTSCLDGW